MERKLFTPLTIGPTTMKHRVVMAPLTRSRSIQPNSIPGLPLTDYDRDTFYTFDSHGYTGYAFYGDQTDALSFAGSVA
jgi:hypothetical protein